MEPKYLGWTLVQEPPAEEYKETKDSKMSFWYYIYLFLGRTLYKVIVSTFWVICNNFKSILIFFVKNIVFYFQAFFLK